MKRYLASLVIFIFPSFSVGDVRITHFDFSDLLGWSSDNHDLALDVFKETCPDLKAPDWSSLCAIAQNTDASREFLKFSLNRFTYLRATRRSLRVILNQR